MILSTCPLRISLFGGSTDNPAFLKKYGRGSVLSFTSNLKTYTVLFKDKLGYNLNSSKYIANYSTREETNRISEIKNEVVRSVFEFFHIEPITVSLYSDIYSQGSGLASSSSYILNLINCISNFCNIKITQSEACKLGLEIERKFNPHCGLQDPYGCGIGGFKRMDFDKQERVSISFIPSTFFNQISVYLIYTEVTRNSKNILNSISNNVDKILPLINIVEEAYDALTREDFNTVLHLINEGWAQKKSITTDIFGVEKIKQLDSYLGNHKDIVAHRLCGAGAGGFFLAFSYSKSLDIECKYIKIELNNEGLSLKNL